MAGVITVFNEIDVHERYIIPVPDEIVVPVLASGNEERIIIRGIIHAGLLPDIRVVRNPELPWARQDTEGIHHLVIDRGEYPVSRSMEPYWSTQISADRVLPVGIGGAVNGNEVALVRPEGNGITCPQIYGRLEELIRVGRQGYTRGVIAQLVPVDRVQCILYIRINGRHGFEIK